MKFERSQSYKNIFDSEFFLRIGVLLAVCTIAFTGCKSNVQANGSAPNGQAATAPAPPPPFDVPAGTTLDIRLNQHISAKTSRAGDQFTGVIADPVQLSDGAIPVPQGANVTGVVDVSHMRGHFKGRSELALRLTSLQFNGQTYTIDTGDSVHSKSGKGKRTAAIVSGTTGAGMIIGGVATGGVGLLVGGLVGAGAGTGVAGLTGNRDISISPETVVHFKLADDLEIQQQAAQPAPAQPNGQQ